MATHLAAVDSTGMQVSVTLGADHLVAIALLSKLAEGGLNDAALQMKHQVQGGLFLNSIELGHSPTVCTQNSDNASKVG